MSVPSPKSPVVSGLACLGIIFLSATLLCAVTPFETQAPPNCANGIDEIVFAKLRALKIEPANVCSDSVFVRRVHLDVTGTLPTAHEAQEFILSRDPKKRSVLIDRLLGQDEYADYWAMKWSDLLRVKAEFPINLWPNAAQAYHHWIRDSVRQNKPYDQFARELLTSTGSNFREPPANFYRAMQNREPSGVVQAVALTFMGVRVDKWSSEQLSKMAIFFTKIGYKYTSEWKEEIVFFDPEKTNSPVVANGYEGILPDKSKIFLRADADPRQAFADWLITPQNPWFTRNIANRMWFWLLGRGIIQEPDDIRSDNPPSNQELLRFLENQLVEAKYDLKGFCRLILNSQTYQLSSVRTTDSPQAEANFAFYPVRRLEAEVLIDAVDDITGSTEKYSSPIPEPFTFIPENQRSIALADGSISSAFLELFGRPPRDTGLAFERNNRPSAAQELHLLNSTHILRKFEQSRMIQFQTDSKRSATEIATGVYLGILSRFPTAEETKIIENYFQAENRKPREAIVDLAWALLNSAEFLYRH